jgi:hypothetical protein
MPLLLRRLLPLLSSLGAPVTPPIHRRGHHEAGYLRACLRCGRRCGLESGPLVMEEGLNGFPQVFDEMKPIHPMFKGYWQMVMIFHFDIVLQATQTSSLGQKRLS